MSYCNVRSPVKHLYLLLGRVEHHCRHVVSQRPSGKFTAPRLGHVQQDLKDKVVMMNPHSQSAGT
ncbi:hypothetical protein LNP74_19455 [Klebsiella pneumoniae subsp. pneumoniae]|nr:hypothetical protein [Klebsiella pneumoniae subsp. pneumoniae]